MSLEHELKPVTTLLSPRKAVKATLVLLPLLGITYMLFFINPGEDDLSQIVFIYFNSFLQSFQVCSPSRWASPLPYVAVSFPGLDAQAWAVLTRAENTSACILRTHPSPRHWASCLN
jgi:hypothetical protein